MIGVKTILVPVKEMDFKDIDSFETKDYIGIWNYASDNFVLLAKCGSDFNCVNLPQIDSLGELDNEVYEECNQHIIGVSTSQNYTLTVV